jgi:hypothetical protein
MAKVIRKSIPFCHCGCLQLVKKPNALYARGHHMRTEKLKQFQRNRDRSQATEKSKLTFQRKYGENITNASQVPELKAKAVQTRRENRPTWGPDTDEHRAKMAACGRLGGLQTKKRWEKNPELFKEFLEKGHEAQRLPGGNYERRTGENNPMHDQKVKEKYTAIMSAKYADPIFIKNRSEKALQTLKNNYGNDLTKLPWIKHKEEHYRWNDSIKRSRGIFWTELSKEIKERDNNQCLLCQESEKILHVHHLIPIRSGEDLNVLNQPQNLVTLCISCHMQIEWKKDLNLELKEIINNMYYIDKKGE